MYVCAYLVGSARCERTLLNKLEWLAHYYFLYEIHHHRITIRFHLFIFVMVTMTLILGFE